jgi:hypothetical protein
MMSRAGRWFNGKLASERCQKRPYLPENPDGIACLVEDEVVEAAACQWAWSRAGGFLAESCENLASDSIRTAQNCLVSAPGNFAT